MKVHVELDMTPEEARAMMGLPDIAPLQQADDGRDAGAHEGGLRCRRPEAMMRAWMPHWAGAEAFEQFQKFLWDSASMVARGGKPKDKP